MWPVASDHRGGRGAGWMDAVPRPSQTKGCKGCGIGVKCIYENARSVMNKLDYLRAEVQVIDPDIIAISESWTNESIGDSELNLTGYTLFRKDRELDIKGGGVLMYVKDCLNASEVKFKSDFPEQVWCKVMCNGNTELFIVCFFVFCGK